MRLSEFSGAKKLVIFDIDDTLVNTETKVHVIKDGRVVRSLNSHDFTHYKLQPGEEFDFEDFRNAREFFEKSRPIIPMIDQLKRDIETGNKVVMVTARADFDDRETFLDTFRQLGIDMSRVHVYRAGNIRDRMATEKKKKIIIRDLLNQNLYDKAIMYDDALPNLHAFTSLKSEYPHTKFYAWHVDHDGRASEYHRTDESLERDNKSADADAVLAYVKKMHNDFRLDHAITDHAQWKLSMVPLSSLEVPDPEPGEVEDDPYNRVQWMDMDTVEDITSEVIRKYPIVADDQGYIIDGNHRALAARLMGITHIPAWTPTDTINEVGDRPADYQADRRRRRSAFHADVDGNDVTVFFDRSSIDGTLQITFTVNGNYEISADYAQQKKLPVFRILSTVLRIIRERLPEYMRQYGPTKVAFTAKGERARSSVYDRYFVPLVTAILGPKFQHTKYQMHTDDPNSAVFSWRKSFDKQSTPVDENFADGKKPGRKGLSKRVGIPKKATLGQLEKIAKSSTGERRRMAQWQLNMRRGRKKSK
jgi:hypothetical protein